MLETKRESIFTDKTSRIMVIFLLILACGLAVRLFDLTDPPLDYAATRQLRSALIARGMYYPHKSDAPEWKREMAVNQGKYSMIEPVIMESLVAGTYRLVGGEYVWIARIYSALFWVLGGAALFFLTAEMISKDAGLIALTFYLFAPFGIVASRTFQPDPLMTALIVAAWWTFYRWHRTSQWKWAVLAGVSAGLAMLVKSTAIFFLLGGMAVLVLWRKRLKETLRDGQMWTIVGLSVLPALVYHIYGLFIVGELGKQFTGRYFPQLWSQLSFYKQWLNALGGVAGFDIVLLLSLLGIFALKKRLDAGFLLGIWFGYILYGFVFSYHITTHYYYHLPVIPLLAVTLGALANYIFSWMKKNRWTTILAQVGLALLLVVGLVGGYVLLKEEDFRHEPGYFETVASFVGPDAKVVALSQDYGYRIAFYGWINPRAWLGSEDLEHKELRGAEVDPFSERFAEYVEGYDYFIVTRMRELERQAKLHDELYQNYPIFKEGGGFVIFDLRQGP